MRFLTFGLLVLMVLLSCSWGVRKEMRGMEPIVLYIDDEEAALSPGAVLKNGDVLVPLEAFGQRVGLKIEYLEDPEQVTICRDDLCIPLMVGDAKQGAVLLSEVAFASPSAFAGPAGLGWRYDAEEKILRIFTAGASEVGLGVGDRAPDFTLPDLSTGTPISLSDFRGQKTAFFMWASW